MVIAAAEPGQWDGLIWAGLAMGLLVGSLLLVIYFRSGRRFTRSVLAMLGVFSLPLVGVVALVWWEGRGGERLEGDLVMTLICGDQYRAVSLPAQRIGWVGLIQDNAIRYTYTRFGGTVAVENRDVLYLPHDKRVRLDIYDPLRNHASLWSGRAHSIHWYGSYLLELERSDSSLIELERECGTDSSMQLPLRFEALSPSDFSRLVDDLRGGGHDRLAPLDRNALLDLGAQVYQRRCAACHGKEGEGSVVVPGLRRSRVVHGGLLPHLDVVLWGRPRSAMKAFYNQLDFIELAAVMSHQRIRWGGHGDGEIQPTLIAAEILAADASRRPFSGPP